MEPLALPELLCRGDSIACVLFDSRAALQRAAALPPTTTSHNSHESGLIYSQEIQTCDMTSKGLFICMGKGNIPKYSPLLPAGD